MEVKQAAGALGAEMTGLDLRSVRTADDMAALAQALADHLVVFLRDQEIDLDELERVTDLLGGRDVTPYVAPVEGRPYVIRVIKEPDDQLNFANAWHSDLSYLPAPPAYTLLHSVRPLHSILEYGWFGAVTRPPNGLPRNLGRGSRRWATASGSGLRQRDCPHQRQSRRLSLRRCDPFARS